jgi:hypothetical protein
VYDVLFSIFILLCWLVSFTRPRDYSSNLRSFELLLTALGIRLLGRYRTYLGTAFIGLAISTFSMGSALAHYGDRLGMAEVDGEKVGNPISLGIPVALLFLLSLAERGRWLMLQDKTPLRFIVNIAAGILLLLSTSRGSWLAVTCSLVVLLVGQRDRGRLLNLGRYLVSNPLPGDTREVRVDRLLRAKSFRRIHRRRPARRQIARNRRDRNKP